MCAAIASLGREPAHLLTAAHEPDDKLASDVHGVIAAWLVKRTTAREAGVVDAREDMMDRSPPQEAAIKARGWMLRYTNAARAAQGMRELPSEWGRTLANRRADSRAINTSTREKKAASGALYHHKHDFAPSNEEIEAMTHAGFVGDKRVHGNELDALEAGMAIALYMATGARGSELKKMHLQSLGHETIQDERSGTAFECLKLTAFETKTKDRHLNQLLAHAHPWRDGVGLFGLSLLVRVQSHGPPPFSMHTDENSWKVFGTSTRTLDDRLKAAFNVAGVRRQTSDPVTYLGRQYGTSARASCSTRAARRRAARRARGTRGARATTTPSARCPTCCASRGTTPTHPSCLRTSSPSCARTQTPSSRTSSRTSPRRSAPWRSGSPPWTGWAGSPTARAPTSG